MVRPPFKLIINRPHDTCYSGKQQQPRPKFYLWIKNYYSDMQAEESSSKQSREEIVATKGKFRSVFSVLEIPVEESTLPVRSITNSTQTSQNSTPRRSQLPMPESYTQWMLATHCWSWGFKSIRATEWKAITPARISASAYRNWGCWSCSNVSSKSRTSSTYICDNSLYNWIFIDEQTPVTSRKTLLHHQRDV